MSVVGEAFVLVSPQSAGFAKKLEGQLAGAGLSNVGLLAGVAVAGGVIAGLNAIGAEFGKVKRIIRQETGAAEEDVTKLFDSVRHAVEQVPVGLEAAGQAVTELFKRGVPLGPQLDKLAKQELFFAKITGSEVGPLVEKTTSLFAKFNVPLREQGKALDVLFKAQQRSGKSLDDLLSPLQSGGAALQAFGFSLEKSAALITQLQIAGVNVGPALAGLRKAFGQLAKEGRDPQAALADLIEEFRKAPDSTKAASDALALFGGRAGPELVAALRSGKFEFGDLLAELTDGKKGILEIGEATLTLSDRIKLLRARIEDTLVPAGLAVRAALVDAFIAISEPLERVGTSVGHLVAALAPVGVALAPIGVALAAVVPLLGAFATGLEAVAATVGVVTSTIGLLPAPVIALAGALGIVALAAAGAADGLIALGIAAAQNPVGQVLIAITALGLVLQAFRGKADPAIKIAKDLNDALFDSESATTIYRAGIDNATQGVQAFVEAELKAANTPGLAEALAASGTTIDALSKAIVGSSSAFDTYVERIGRGVRATSEFKDANKNLFSNIGVRGPISEFEQLDAEQRKVIETLRDQRQAFELSARKQLDAAVATEVLTKRQAEYVIGLHKNADGSRNFAAELDDVNRRLAASAQVQNEAVTSTNSFGDAVAGLAQDLADGVISSKDAEASLGALGIVGEEVARQLARVQLAAQDITDTQDHLALSTITTSDAYGELARGLATGNTTVAAATLALEDMGLSAAAAATQAGELDSAIKAFVDGALSQVPGVGDAIDAFAKQIEDSQSSLADDREKNVELHQKLNEAVAKGSADTLRKLQTVDLAIQQDQAKIAAGVAGATDKLASDQLKRSQILSKGGEASADLAKQVEESDAKIRASQKALADSQDPDRFTDRLLDNVRKIATFNASLSKLVDEGFGVLAGELAKKGPEAAAGLAASLASSPAKAAIASKAAELGKTTTDNYRKFLEENFPELTGTGAKQGLVIGKAIADGITRELEHNFPLLRQLGITSGDEILGGTETGVAHRDPTAPIRAAFRAQGGRWKPHGELIGTEAGAGVVDALGRINPTSKLAATLRAHREDVHRAGSELGTSAGEGIAAGIRGQFTNVGNAVLAVTQHGVAVAKGAWKITSPSKVFAEIGGQAGAGLAQGLSSSATEVGDAAALLASQTTVSINDALSAEQFTAQIHPEITPTITLPDVPPLPPIPATLTPIPPPTIAPVVVPAELGRIATPALTPVTLPVTVPALAPITATIALEPIEIPDLAPLPATVALAPIPTPVLPALEAHLAPIPVPEIPPLEARAILAPIDVPDLPPLRATLAPLRAPALAPLTARAVLAPITIPELPLLRAHLAPIPTPRLPPLPATVDLAPFTIPDLEPLHAELAPIDAPRIASIEPLVATLAPIAAPELPPIRATLAPLTVPPLPVLAAHAELAPIVPPELAPIAARAVLAPIAVPELAPIAASLAPLTVPAIEPVTVAVAPLTAPEIPPITASLAPLTVPPIPPAVVTASIAPLELPPLPPITPTIAAVSSEAAAAAFAPLSRSGAQAGREAAQGLAAGLSAFTPSVDPARFSVAGTAAGEAAGAGVTDGLLSSATTISAAFQQITVPDLDLTGTGREIGRRLSDEVVDAGRTAGFAAGDAGALIASSLATSVSDRLAGVDLRPGAVLSFVDKLRVAFEFIGDQKSAANFVSFAGGLVDTFHQAAEKITVDAGELRKVLDALTQTHTTTASGLKSRLLAELKAQGLLIEKVAAEAPPSRLTIAAQEGNVQVARPEQRADAERQLREAQRDAERRGVFAGATVQFPDKTDPLHVAAEIAWRLNP